MSTLPRPLDLPRRSRITLLIVAAHALLWVVWLLGLFWVAPQCERIFREFNMSLPSMTVLVLNLTHGVVSFALLLVPVFLVVDGTVYLCLRRSVVGSVVGSVVWVLWSALMTVVPVVVILFTVVALWLPQVKLQEGLSK